MEYVAQESVRDGADRTVDANLPDQVTTSCEDPIAGNSYNGSGGVTSFIKSEVDEVLAAKHCMHMGQLDLQHQ
ncbi:LOW QUALITY PROTEIN: hypothetical protein PHMEG_0007633 [Phytophthora megakarya]|uniref:Uncharacterized protein n=1 Tax=Phytophthora megakarya TaxID=4795 RepID=A0A225WKR3_9STRA|nr:LOW QUALITY PROTEIN: hypothetical protein PHMEG_0007633 [Phytophthora megakarya]